MLALRSVVFNIVFYTMFVVLMVVALPCLLMPMTARVAVVRLWARMSIALLATICGTRIEFRGRDQLPHGAAILAVKHQSFLETFALIAAIGDFSYILKKELMAIPLFGWYLRFSGQIGIVREKRASALPLLEKAVRQKLEAGRQIIIFPEGTRLPVGAPPAYKPGVSVLCARAHVPCTPVALNTGLFWPRRSWLRRPGTVVIEFLPPIAPGLRKRDFMDALEDAIESATNALVAEALAADPRLDESLVEQSARPVLN